MVSVRITATGAVVIASLSFLTAPVSACDERFIKKCEKASAAAAEAAATVPTAKRKSAGQVQMVVSRRSKHIRFVKRARGPGFAMKRDGRMVLASAEVRATLPESALARRFRGFISPQPIAQNAFEALRKPHIVAVNLEPPMTSPAMEATAAEPEAPAAAPVAAAAATTAKQDRAAPKPAAKMELASAESRPVTLPEIPPVQTKPVSLAVAHAAATPSLPQTSVTETPTLAPAAPAPSGFSIHQLVLALCGALGAASALRFIVGA